MTLLTIIQDACGLLALSPPTSVIGSSDPTARQLLALAIEEGRDLAGRAAWQALVNEDTFVTVGQSAQTNALPADLDRFVENTFFNRTTMLPVAGPITSQQWQAIQAQPQLNRVVLAFYQRTGQFLVTPPPPAGQTIAYEYLSKNWVKGSNGAGKSRFTADDDSCLIDEWLMTIGLRWRYRKSKGFEYGEDFQTYERQVTQALARDGGSTAIDIGGGTSGGALSNLPPGSFPGPA